MGSRTGVVCLPDDFVFPPWKDNSDFNSFYTKMGTIPKAFASALLGGEFQSQSDQLTIGGWLNKHGHFDKRFSWVKGIEVIGTDVDVLGSNVSFAVDETGKWREINNDAQLEKVANEFKGKRCAIIHIGV